MFSRRSFLAKVSAIVGGVLALPSLLKGARAPINDEKGTIVLKDWRNGRSVHYVFEKGPDYTTAEEAYPEMAKIIPDALNSDGSVVGYRNGASWLDCNSRIVKLKSISMMKKFS